MTAPRPATPADVDQLATIIPLMAPERARAERERADALLVRLAGEGATDLPATLGRAAARIETLLATGPTAIEPTLVAPGAAIDAAERILASAGTALELIREEAEVLGEALATDLCALSLDHLGDIAEAVLALSLAPTAAPSWAEPAAANAAELVLEAAADDLREAACIHERLYQHFTEAVWNVPVALVRAGNHRWRVIARARLRGQLRGASRNGRVGSLGTATDQLLAVRTSRERLAAVAPLLSHHLEQLDRGPLSDVDAALSALSAVRELQHQLGDLLDAERLGQLLLADAFRSPDVVGPAVTLRTALRAWAADVEASGAADDGCHLDLRQLSEWTIQCDNLLDALVAGHAATVRAGTPAPTLRALVEILLVRQRVHELAESDPPRSSDRHQWSAS